jgi:hypothetical protein
MPNERGRIKSSGAKLQEMEIHGLRRTMIMVMVGRR